MANDPNTIQYVIQEDGFWYVASKEKNPYVPELTVSAKGIANGLSTEYNDGCDFGPDSYNPSVTSGVPLTQTSGIQEAHLYRVSLARQIPAGTPWSFIPRVELASGTFICNEDIVVYPNNDGILGQNTTLLFKGQGRNSISQIIFQGNAKYGFDFSGATAGTNIHLSHINLRASSTDLTSLINAQLPTSSSGNYLDIDDVQLASGSGTLTNGIMISGIAYTHLVRFSSEINTTTNFVNVTGAAAGVVWFKAEAIRGAGPVTMLFNANALYMVDIELKDTLNISMGSASNIFNFRLRGTQRGTLSNAGTIHWAEIDCAMLVGSPFITNSGTIRKLIIKGFLSPQVSSGNLISNTGTIGYYENSAHFIPNGTYSINLQTTVSGTTAGSFIASMPIDTSMYKKVMIYLDAYENDSTTAQTYTYPVPFSTVAEITSNTASVPVVSTSLTEFSIAPDTTTAYTGIIVIEGY